MQARVSPVPTPQLVVADAAAAIDFYRQAFGAHELYRNHAPDGRTIVHAELLLGAARFFVHDEVPAQGLRSPRSIGGTAVTLHLYVPDVDALFARAAAHGADIILPVDKQFWGDRYGIMTDPFEHRWSFASRVEDLSPDETHERSEQFNSNDKGKEKP
jgi:PhnB protein